MWCGRSYKTLCIISINQWKYSVTSIINCHPYLFKYDFKSAHNALTLYFTALMCTRRNLYIKDLGSGKRLLQSKVSISFSVIIMLYRWNDYKGIRYINGTRLVPRSPPSPSSKTRSKKKYSLYFFEFYAVKTSHNLCNNIKIIIEGLLI